MGPKKFFLLVLILLAVVALTAACKSGDDAAEPTTAPVTATSTPVPQPTSTPTPVPAYLDAIAINPEEDPEGFLAALPRGEVDCAEKVVGGHAQLIDVIADESELDPAEAVALSRCVSKETVQRTFIGALEEGAGELSAETEACVLRATVNVGFASQFTDTPVAGDIVGMFQGMFCLNDDERAAMETSDSGLMFDAGGPGINELECAFDELGPDKIASTFSTLSAGDISAFDADFFKVAIACGVIDEAQFNESGMTVEQMACLLDKGGPAFQSFISSAQSGTPPDLSQLATLAPAFEQCGVDFGSLSDGPPTDEATPASGTPTAGGNPPGLELTAAQAACISEKLSPALLTSMQSGNVSPDTLPQVIAAATQCEVDVTALFAPR
jgi:hypothetical protein